MKRWLTSMLVVVVGGVCASEALAFKTFKTPFSREEVAACGENCVHGYWLNLGARLTYFAGDTASFNAHIEGLQKAKDEFPAPPVTSKKVVLHPGSLSVSREDDPGRNIATDWSVSASRVHLQIDVWLGGRIKLDDLRIPADFEVVSSGEIEKFIEARKGMSK